MLKKLLLAAVLAAPMCLFAQNKIGSVNSQDVFMLMPEVKTAQTTLQEVSKKYDTEFKALQGEFEKKLAEYQALAKDTPESIRQRREGELLELQAKIQNFQEVAGQDLQRQQQTLMALIQEKILTAIKAVGDENGFTYIFDLTSPSIVYTGKDAVDVTPLVKQKLNLKDAPATPAPTNTPAK